MAAAAVLLLLATGVWLWKDDRPTHPLPQYATAGQPGKPGAVLTLSDGRQVLLDSAGDGLLASDNTVKVVKKDGRIVYEGMAGESLYNTISTLKGQQWQLTLGDGTRVWLNAASSIHYPLSFTDSARVVEITGEACFEVTPNSNAPFLVRAGKREIRVLGTRFNVNAYADEPVFKATLLNGAVSVGNGLQTVLLQPGEQAVEQEGGNGLGKQQTDTSNVMAWINGRFRFDQSDLQTVMRQIARWYDMEIEYKGAIPGYHFAGGTFRSSRLEEVLEVLALSGVHFKVENRKIIVMQ
jgi:ferric-dicitrate binding protein FerR (iron transport regulator)